MFPPPDNYAYQVDAHSLRIPKLLVSILILFLNLVLILFLFPILFLTGVAHASVKGMVRVVVGLADQARCFDSLHGEED